MRVPPARRKSLYADRLAEFPELVLSGDSAYTNQGRWRQAFADRMGAAFDGRVIVEAGCDDARFLAEVASRHPTAGFVGIDWKARAVYDGAGRVRQSGLTNLLLLHAHAEDVCRLFGPSEVDEWWVLHPEPCANVREFPNRLINERFLLDVASVLRDRASRFVLKTDHAGYFASVLALFGLPEPQAYTLSRQAELAGLPRPTPGPKFRRGDLTDGFPVANRSARVIGRFETPLVSIDYWNDAPVQRQTADRLHAGLSTPYESRFKAKKIAIGYLDATRLARNDAAM
jgi:tRNA G46 methylase TrmB